MKILIALLCCLIALASVSATDINTCQILNVPGTYNLVANLSGSVVHAGTTHHCLTIATDNITIDCHGHSVSTDSGGWGAIGDTITTPTSDVSIKNCALANTTLASTSIYLSQATYKWHILNNTMAGGMNYDLFITNGFFDGIIENNYFTNKSIYAVYTQSIMNGTIFSGNLFFSDGDLVLTGTSNFSNNILTNNIFNASTPTPIITITGGSPLGANTWFSRTSGNVYATLDNLNGYSNFCSDANNDSVCDDAYAIDGQNIDPYPLKRIGASYLSSYVSASATAPILTAKFLGYVTIPGENIGRGVSYDWTRTALQLPLFFANPIFALFPESTWGTDCAARPELCSQIQVIAQPGANLTASQREACPHCGEFAFLVGMNSTKDTILYDALSMDFSQFVQGGVLTNVKIDWTSDYMLLFAHNEQQRYNCTAFHLNSDRVGFGQSLVANFTCPDTVKILAPAATFNNGGVMTISFAMKPTFIFADGISSFTLVDNIGQSVGQLIFYYNGGSQEVNITQFYNDTETLLVQNSSYPANAGYQIIVTLDFTRRYYTLRLSNRESGSLLIAFNQTLTNENSNAISELLFNSYFLDTPALTLGPIDFSSDSTTIRPAYSYFDMSHPNEYIYHILYAQPIAYGKYLWRIYATDSENGLQYYGTYGNGSIDFNAHTVQIGEVPMITTPELEKEIAAAYQLKNQSAPLVGESSSAGDLIEDYFPKLLDASHVRSKGSRFLVGILLIGGIVAAGVSLGGSIGGVLGFIVGIVANVYIGLWEWWIAAVLVIIAAALSAMYARRFFGGQ